MELLLLSLRHVILHGPEQLSDDELLRRAISRVDEPERTVRRLKQERDAAAARTAAYGELEAAYRKACAAHRRMRRAALTLGLVAAGLFVLLVVSVLVAWRLLT